MRDIVLGYSELLVIAVDMVCVLLKVRGVLHATLEGVAMRGHLHLGLVLILIGET